MKKLLLILFLIPLAFTSCTKNQRAKSFGGDAELKVPCNQMVTNITWKKEELWYSTVPMTDNYAPKTHTFREESSFGMIEGTYTLIECICGKEYVYNYKKSK